MICQPYCAYRHMIVGDCISVVWGCMYVLHMHMYMYVYMYELKSSLQRVEKRLEGVKKGSSIRAECFGISLICNNRNFFCFQRKKKIMIIIILINKNSIVTFPPHPKCNFFLGVFFGSLRPTIIRHLLCICKFLKKKIKN